MFQRHPLFAVGENPTIDMIGSPDKVINAFGPEVIGQVVDDKVVYARSVTKEDSKLYYQFELNQPHVRTSLGSWDPGRLIIA